MGLEIIVKSENGVSIPVGIQHQEQGSRDQVECSECFYSYFASDFQEFVKDCFIKGQNAMQVAKSLKSK